DHLFKVRLLKKSLPGILHPDTRDMGDILHKFFPFGNAKCLQEIAHLTMHRCWLTTEGKPMLYIEVNRPFCQISRNDRAKTFFQRIDTVTGCHHIFYLALLHIPQEVIEHLRDGVGGAVILEAMEFSPRT